MKVAVVGGGPIGLVAAYGLAEQGHEVDVLDPDPGPPPSGAWRRRGVMQFLHPHAYRPQVGDVLRSRMPGLWDAVLAAGGETYEPPPGMDILGLACRRWVFETGLRAGVLAHPRVRAHCATARGLVVDGDRVVGVDTDDGELPAELVVGANGRSSKFAEELRPPAEGGACGQSYVTRMYRARPGVEAPVGPPDGKQSAAYETIMFPQDDRTLSALIVRPSFDAAFSLLWQEPCYEAAVAAIPHLAPWTDPERFEPITPVMRGGTLTNTYRQQGELPAGVVFIGDAVCTTNPSAGRGLTLGLLEVDHLLGLVTEHGAGKDLTAAFEAWCEEHVKPWYVEHVRTDAWVNARYAGEDVDVEAPLCGGLIVSAAFEDPSLMPLVMGHLMMTERPPDSLAAAEPIVRERLRAGWRPSFEPAPSRGELVEVMERVAAA